jgi:membrane complex biogenesis BtpA family protein
MLDQLRERPFLIGVVHLQPLPGSPRFRDTIGAVQARALEDAEALLSGRCDALIVENYGDVPFYPGAVPPETVAAIAVCVRSIVELARGTPVGVNVLRNDARAALGICAATGACFLRVNVHTGAAVTDQGVIEGRAHELLRERARLGLAVSIFADVHVKHATPLGRETQAEAASDAVERGLADALIVSGRATGRPPEAREIADVVRAARGVPVVVGSGLDASNAAELLAIADGAIVGTALERDGRTAEPIERARVERLRRTFDELARSRTARTR